MDHFGDTRICMKPLKVGTCLLILAVASFPIGSTRTSYAASGTPKLINAGIVALLANPQRYNHKVVRTIGFLCLEYERNALYLHEEDYRYQNDENALALRLSKDQVKQFKALSLRHVIVEGTMEANVPESYGGTLRDITRLQYWGPRRDIPAPAEEPKSHCSIYGTNPS